MYRPTSPKVGLFGQFTFYLKDQLFPVVIPNVVTDEGELEYLKMIVQADVALIAAAGNFYVGLTSGVFDGSSILADIAAGEPTAAGGYARQPITRDSLGWPTIDTINGVGRAQSDLVQFAAAGANFDKAITKAFLTDQAAGTVGVLLGVSAGLPDPVTVLDGQSFDMRYELFLRGSP